MKKLFTLLMLMVCAVGTVGAQTFTIYAAKGTNCVQTRTDGETGDFFTIDYGGQNTNTGYACKYAGVSYEYGFKTTSAFVISFTPTKEATVTIVQSIAKNGSNTIKFDGEVLSGGETISDTENTNVKVYKFTTTANTEHKITRGNKEAGIALVKVEYPQKEVQSEKITNATINGVSIAPEDLTKLIETKNLILDQAIYQTAPTVIFTNTKTYSDNSSETENITAEMTEDADFFIATAVIGGDTYTIKVGRDKSVKSNDATLKSLNVNNEPINGFNAETLSYNIELPFGITQIPTVTAEATSSVATVSITQATALPGTATVVVTAEDGVTTNTYTINFTVSKGSSEKELTKAMFSNGFDGFIKDNIVDGSIESSIVEAYYMEGTEVPTLKEVTVSAKATYSVNGETLTVTAEDGTMKEYTIKLEPVAPYTGLGRVFDGTESGWIKTGNSFDTAKNKGWRFSKNHDTNNTSDLSRIIEGKNRLYFFIDACNSVTLKVATGSTSARKIKVYKNGNEDASITNLPKYAEGANINIQCDPSSPCMIAIVSNQDGGDGGFGEIIVDKPAPASITLNSFGYNTYSNANTVTVTGAVAYTCTVNKETNKAVLRELGTVVPAGQGVLLKGETNGTVSFGFGGEEPVIAQNDFQPVLKATATPADKAIYVLKDNKFMKYVGATLVANKAYIELGSTAGAKALSIEFDGETTDIGGIKAVGTDDNAPVYNLQGQRVDINTKGIIIKNGKKIINK